MARPARSPAVSATSVPAPVRALLERLARAGHPSVLVGGCVRDLLEARPVHDFDVATPAPPERVLALFPTAVPTGLRHGTVLVPTAAGPVDVTTFRAPDLEGDLARRDFTVNALALRLEAPELVDPAGGLRDLAAGRLRAVGRADDRLAEDPLRALRAARLAAERGWRPDGELVDAMARVAPRLAAVAGERVRAELERLLVAPDAGEGLRLLARTGIAEVLAPGSVERADEIVDALPHARDERLAGWLLGSASPARTLARLRLSRATAARVERLLRAHPVHAGVDPGRPASVRRLLHRLAPVDVEALLALAAVAGPKGEAPPPGTLEQLDALRAAVARVRADERLALGRDDLALDGDDVMAILGRPPGPEIGEALRYLTDCVIEHPEDNEPAKLRARLEAWAKARR